jgi:glycosyltransferase involved in cell wall biosynthesis
VRILHISSAKTISEAERHLACLCREFTRRGHEMFVALRPTNQWQDVLDFLPPENLLHISIRNSFAMFNARQTARFIEQRKIDIIHAHNAKDYLAASVIHRSAASVKLVLTRHVSAPLKPFHRFALRNVDAAIGLSPATSEHLRSTFVHERIFTVCNGLEFDSCVPDPARGIEFRNFHNIPRDAPLVVTVGELKVTNGQRDLVLAAAEIVKRFPECRFVIAGTDPSIDKKFKRELKRLVKVLGLDSAFLWLEPTEDFVQLLETADVFVSATYSGELLAGAVGAIAAGVPMVATSTNEFRSVEGVFPAKDPLALATAISKYLSAPDLRREHGRRLQTTVSKMFSVERMIDEIEAVYERLLRQ